MTDGRALILVRHGETVGNSSIRYFGRTDLLLSPLGRAQMGAVANWLASSLQTSRFAPVFSSPLCRATEGARLIAGTLAPVVEIQEFVEVDFGLFEGLTAEEIRERYPVEFDRWNRDRLDPAYAYPGGESRAAFVERVGRGAKRMVELLDGTAATADSPAALLVAHRGVIRAITQRLAGVEPVIELGSIQVLRRTSGNPGWRAEALDVTEHLNHIE
ncbi:MAG TPA: histidine phosphatase family protein [Candidatus Binataceae bacterium]|nr:histidine phosphatase family protein [Candidatus Binataceae bacterium]